MVDGWPWGINCFVLLPSVASFAVNHQRFDWPTDRLTDASNIRLTTNSPMSNEQTNELMNQFPNPPISAGNTMKKLIKKAWAVTRTL
jgi:hypothetical protein